jgi:glycine/D-amino acid oxidase-like deaminating enzyme
MDADVVVIGAGTVGAAIGYGLAGRNVRVLVLDGNDRDFRAANANFGLVWLHGKGLDMPDYYRLTRRSVEAWSDFAAELAATSAIDLHYERSGGLMLCQGDAQLEQRRASLMRLKRQVGSGTKADWEMIDRTALEKLLPKAKLGSTVSGASFGSLDGHANPLRLLAALHAGILRRGGELHAGSSVEAIEAQPGGGFTLRVGAEKLSAARIVIAAGIGSRSLAAQVGLDIPIRAQRGQILVTERLAPFLPLPTPEVRQTREGTVMIGATHEEVGLDCSTTSRAGAALSANAIRQFPALRGARLVRQWAGLRILTPDGFPIYAQSQPHPGAFLAICHSGVTLAAFHADLLAGAVADGRLPRSFNVFHHRRFDVPQAA